MSPEAILAAYVGIIMGFPDLLAIKIPKPTLYRNLLVRCDHSEVVISHQTNTVVWTFNGTRISPKKGKYLLSGETLEILDIRYEDSGTYECSSSPTGSPYINFTLSVLAPESRFASIHSATVPLSSSEEINGKIYWHPKMKRQPIQYNMYDKPMSIACYFYLSGDHVRSRSYPNVQWFPSLGRGIQVKKVEEIDCDSLEESQRKLDGHCFESTLQINYLEATEEIGCNVSKVSEDGRQTEFISTYYWIFKDLLPKFLSDSSISDDISSPNSDLFFNQIDDYSFIDEITSNWDFLNESVSLDQTTQHPSSPTRAVTTTTAPTTRTLTSPPQVTQSFDLSRESVGLDLLSLQIAPPGSIDFVLLQSVVCETGQVTLYCSLPHVQNQLEIWFVGLRQQKPKLLKTSQVDAFIIKSKRGKPDRQMYSFHSSVSLHLENVSDQHSGVYVCRISRVYTNITITVTPCLKIQRNIIPPMLIWVIIAIIITVVLLTLVICIRSMRKSTTIFKFICSPDSTNKNLTVYKHLQIVKLGNPLYQNFHTLLVNEKLESQIRKQEQLQLDVEQVRLGHRTAALSISRIFRRNNHTLPKWLHYKIESDLEWEIPRVQIQHEELIGKGSFGLVYRGRVMGCLPAKTDLPTSTDSVTLVAIKTLQDDFTEGQLANFVEEMEIMKKLGSHPYIIRLMGLCTQGGPPLILLEYAIHGNLRDFLRQHRPTGFNIFGWDSRKLNYCEFELSHSCSNLYLNLFVQLGMRELLKFAWQIATALAYLESKNLVHRDVAARNVVLTDGYVAKLCDFGFTRFIDKAHSKDNQEQLPYRWLAPECFEDNNYTTKSDVWSFGILLWEIFTFGNHPYPQIETNQLYNHLMEGHRNDKPQMATMPVYDLMLNCWKTDPCERPDFLMILNRLNSILETLDLRLDSIKTYEGYLTMESPQYLEPRQSLVNLDLVMPKTLTESDSTYQMYHHASLMNQLERLNCKKIAFSQSLPTLVMK